jgi:hypothetical protein
MVMVHASRLGIGTRLVLVDGGPLLPAPHWLSPDADPTDIAATIKAVVGVAYARLARTFSSPEEYVEFWRAHPSFTEWSDAIGDYVDYDLVQEDDGWHAACRLVAAETDALEFYNFTGEPEQPLPVPGVFLRGERGMLNEPEPFYPADYAERILPGVTERFVPDVNHYTIAMSPRGAAVVADAVRNG